MAIGKKRLAEQLSQAITGAIITAAEPQLNMATQKDDTCAQALIEFAKQTPAQELQPVPDWRLLTLLP